MTKPVGFDQKILLHHLDFTAKQVKKFSRKEMYDVLDGYLREDIAGAKSRKNTITILMKIWYNVDQSRIPFRDEILSRFYELSKEERLLIHWGMTMAAYPFFQAVANELGRLFKLQENVASSTISRRIKDLYGDRRKVEVATSAVLSSMKAWGVIFPDKKRTYVKNEVIHITNPFLHSFIVNTLLNTLDKEALFVDIIENHATFFPFFYDLKIDELRRKREFVFYHEGMKHLVVERA